MLLPAPQQFPLASHQDLGDCKSTSSKIEREKDKAGASLLLHRLYFRTSKRTPAFTFQSLLRILIITIRTWGALRSRDILWGMHTNSPSFLVSLSYLMRNSGNVTRALIERILVILALNSFPLAPHGLTIKETTI